MDPPSNSGNSTNTYAENHEYDDERSEESNSNTANSSQPLNSLNGETKDHKEDKNADDLDRDQVLENTSEDDSEDEDDEPPILKYTRLSKLPATFFERDPVSASCFHETVFIFGTHSGFVHLCHPDFTPIRTFKAHRASVLSLYCDGAYFASGSMDGTVVIGSCSDEKDVVMFDYKRPIHAVVLDKNYYKSRAFVYGGMAGKVIYSSKSWLDQRVELVLDEEAGPIVGILSIDDLLIWMNDKGITVYHITSKQVISVIAKPSDSFRSDLYWPRISFPETDRVLIAWGNYIWSLKAIIKPLSEGGSGAGTSIKSRYLSSARSLSFRSVNEKKIEVEHVFKVDFLISGIASYKDDLWFLLAYVLPEKDEKTGRMIPQNPDIKLVSSIDGTLQHEEEIDFNTSENLGLNDYSLGIHIGDRSARYFIVSARGAVIAEQVQLDDQLQWYLDRHMFLTAWQMSQHIVSPTKRLKYGIRHVDGLLKENEWLEASEMLEKILYVPEDRIPLSDARSTLATKFTVDLIIEATENLIKEVAEQWELWSTIFLDAGHEKELTNIIPLDTRWNLPKSIYTRLLGFWVRKVSDDDTLYGLLQNWELDLYEPEKVCNFIEEELEKDPNDRHLRRVLCELYEKNLEPKKAILHLSKLRDPETVQFLAKNHLLSAYILEIPQFSRFRFDNDDDIEKLPTDELQSCLKGIISILVDARHEILPSTVLKVMFENHVDILNYFYLEQLSEIDDIIVRPFENERIKLYVQYDRAKLMHFLQTHSEYNIQQAVDLCDQNGFVNELVFLLGKTGESEKAMSLILEKLNDPYTAIRFAKLQNEKHTWSQLLEFSYSRPEYIKALLEMADENSSAYYNPMTILQNLNTNVHIEGLKDSVIGVAGDLEMTLLVNELILAIVNKRTKSISQAYFWNRINGLEINGDDLKPMMKNRENTIVLLKDSEKGYELIKESEINPDAKHSRNHDTSMESKLRHFKKLNKLFWRWKESASHEEK